MIRKLSKSLRLPWRKSRTTGNQDHLPATKSVSSSSDSSASLKPSPQTSDLLDINNFAEEQFESQDHAHAEIVKIRSFVTEIKRQLKLAHRDLEVFQNEQCHGFDNEAETLASEATRHAWQAYRSMVKLEEALRSAQDDNPRTTDGNKAVHVLQGQHEANRPDGRRQVYIPTGACENTQSTFGTERAINQLNRRDYTTARITSGQEASLVSYQDGQGQFPQPRDEVERSIHHEEASLRASLNEPDKVRRGSCDGYVIANMIMSGLEDHRFVLPYFHYIKHHEVRALEEWLSTTNHMAEFDTISLMESVLHCIQILQTGCRYETLAVIFSRSPRQIKGSCREVMRGLLHLHRNTVNEVGDQEIYMPLWGIWRKFVMTKGRAELYYGFGWVDLAKVLVTLNLYIGRWRMQGRFATDGPAFVWGRFFVSRGLIEHVPHLLHEAPEGDNSSDASGGDADSTSTVCPGTIARQESFE